MDSITREDRLNILCALKLKVNYQLVDIFNYQEKEFYKEITEKESLLTQLLLDETKVIPPEILREGREILPS